MIHYTYEITTHVEYDSTISTILSHLTDFCSSAIFFNTKFAILEAINNAIEHGSYPISICLHFQNQEDFYVTIKDAGLGYCQDLQQLQTLPEENLYDKRGRGLFLIHSLTTHVLYNETGNEVTLFFSNRNTEDILELQQEGKKEELYTYIVDFLSEMIPVNTIFIAKNDGYENTIVKVNNKQLPLLEEGDRSPLDAVLCKLVLTYKGPLVINSLKTHPLTKNHPITKAITDGSFLGVELYDNGKNIGTLCAFDTKPYEFSLQEIKLIQMLAALL